MSINYNTFKYNNKRNNKGSSRRLNLDERSLAYESWYGPEYTHD